MSQNALAEKLRRGETALGVLSTYAAPSMLESLCVGWDWAWIDGQHGQYGFESLLTAVQVARSAGVPSVLRTPGHEAGVLGKFADMCPDGIIVPMVDDADQAAAIVRGLRFPPLGNRSFGGRRPIDLYGRTYIRDHELLVLAQIETLGGAENVEAILAVEGIDGVFFGPDDMKLRMGVDINVSPGDVPEVRDAQLRTADAARAAGKIAACWAGEPRDVISAAGLGYRMIAGGADALFIEASRGLAASLRKALAGPENGGGPKMRAQFRPI